MQGEDLKAGLFDVLAPLPPVCQVDRNKPERGATQRRRRRTTSEDEGRDGNELQEFNEEQSHQVDRLA